MLISAVVGLDLSIGSQVLIPHYSEKDIKTPASTTTYLDQTWVGWQDTKSSLEVCVGDQRTQLVDL